MIATARARADALHRPAAALTFEPHPRAFFNPDMTGGNTVQAGADGTFDFPLDLTRSPLERLSDREFEVFELIGQGLTVRAIASKLQLSPKTIETHREHIKEKLELKNATELTKHAVQWVLEHG